MFQVMTPCNTPATPPNFPDTLMAFSRMSAGSATSSSPNSSGAGVMIQQQQQTHHQQAQPAPQR